MVSSMVVLADSDTANCNASVRLSDFMDAFIWTKTRNHKNDKYSDKIHYLELDLEDLVGIACLHMVADILKFLAESVRLV